MSFKSDIYQKDYLFWITPFIILFLIFCVLKRDNKARDAAIMNTHRSDSTLTLKTRKAEGTDKVKITDSTFIYFAGTRANNAHFTK